MKAARAPPAGPHTHLSDWVPCALVVWATAFNAVLAVANAHGATLTPASVIAAETATTGASVALALLRHRPEMRVWWAMLGAILLIFALLSLGRGDVQAKNVRDVLIIPTYILLGLAAPRRRLNTTVCLVHAVVILFALYEALDTEGYAKLFDVQSYYINTRGYNDDNFWNKQSDLFVSAVRPGDRMFLPFLNLHRLSSIFLEPVSLGNYCSIVTVFVCARFRQLSRALLAFLIAGNVLLMIGCDGRLAAFSSLVIIVVASFAPRTPRGTAILYLPLVLIAAFAATDLLKLRAGPDDLAGRIAHTVDLLRQYDLQDYFAMSDRFIWAAVDSGVAYLTMTQTIVGFAVIWIFIVFGAAEDRAEEIRFTHGTIVYLALAMMVSFAILTIKTAALLWFIQGVLQRIEAPRSAAAAARPPRLRPPWSPLSRVPDPTRAGEAG